MAERAALLLAFAFGIFHTAILLLVLVTLLHRSDEGAQPLEGLGMADGIVIGLWLAVISCGATFWALRGVSLAAPPAGTDLAGRAGLGGFFAGALFIAGLFLGGAVVTKTFEPAVLVFLLFATSFAGAFGAAIGLALASVDVLVYRVTRALARAGDG